MKFKILFFAICSLIFSVPAMAANDFIPCTPDSDYLVPPEGGPTLDFCSEWNPEFGFHGYQCCPKPQAWKGRRHANRCSPHRVKTSYCDEMTLDQRMYSNAATAGKLGDLMKLITFEMGKKGDQAYCTVNNGFLAYGRRLIPTPENHLMLRSPLRCVDFGTDSMIGMIEWLGRQVASSYALLDHSKAQVLVGDVSAPRGGCLSGRGGRRGHASHMAGQDADIGFFNPMPTRNTDTNFVKWFDPNTNWWFIKQVFKNPYACIKVIFLDRHLIAKLARTEAVTSDPDWIVYRRFIHHVPGHGNHMHVRIGNGPGQVGCVPNAKPELEQGDDAEDESGGADFSGAPDMQGFEE